MDTEYFVNMIEEDLDNILNLEILKDEEFTRKLFKQKSGDKVNFYKNVIKQSEIQPDYWGRALMFIFRFGRYIHYHCESEFWDKVYKMANREIIEGKLNCSLPRFVDIGFGTKIYHPYNIVINAKANLGQKCTLRHSITIGNKGNNSFPSPSIGDNVNIGSNASIFGDISIGSNSFVGGGAVVTKSFPENSKLVGNPAKNLNEAVVEKI